jgi:hypothetical protein
VFVETLALFTLVIIFVKIGSSRKGFQNGPAA